MNDNDTALFISAAKDAALNSIPHRKADGSFEFSKGQQTILNKLLYQPLRHLLYRIQSFSQEREKYKKTKVAINKQLEIENERFMHESTVSSEKLQEAEFDEESKASNIQNFENDLAIRNIQLIASPEKSKEPAKQPEASSNWKSLIFSFVFSDLLMTALLWNSMRDFLDIREVITRSVGILTIFINIHIASRLKVRYGTAFLYFQIFAFLMLISAMFLNPLLSEIYPVNSIQENEWDLTNTVIPDSITSVTPLAVALYRKFSITEAVLTSLMLFALSQFLPPKQIKDGNSDQIDESTRSYPHLELLQRKEHLEQEKVNSEKLVKRLTNDQDRMKQSHQTTLDLFLYEINKADAEINRIDSLITDLHVEFDTLFNQLSTELESYAIEFRSNLTKDSIRNIMVNNICWPEKADILRYLKIS